MNTGISQPIAISLCVFLTMLNCGYKTRNTTKSAPQTTNPEETRSNKTSTVDLVKALKDQDLKFHPIGLGDFITDNQTKKGDQVLAGKYSIKGLSVYRVPKRRKGEKEKFGSSVFFRSGFIRPSLQRKSRVIMA